jgi:hypothetical protein
MKENIGATLVTLCSGLQKPVTLYLSEAECDEYPYAVYEADYVPSYDKDGMYKIVGDITVRAYSKDYSEAQDIADSVDSAILTNFASGSYTVRQMSQLKKECLNETWSVGYQYRITQFRSTTTI